MFEVANLGVHVDIPSLACIFEISSFGRVL